MKKACHKYIKIGPMYAKSNLYECEECNKEDFVNLTNVSICKFEDSYTCECDDFGGTKFDWLHVNSIFVILYDKFTYLSALL